MGAYVITDLVSIADPDRYLSYREMSGGIVAKHGGKYLARGGPVTVLEGGWEPSRLVVVEFSSVETAVSWWESSDYSDAKALRQASAVTNMVVVDGVR